MNPHLKKWLRVSFFNLLLIALAGVIMRYKIAYALPWINQKNLLQAHSHFAFAGWVTQALMSLLVGYLSDKGDSNAFTRYRPLLWANLVSAYGMLLTFPFTGYAVMSISFSTTSILVSYWFAIAYWRDLNRLQKNSIVHKWVKAAVIFNAISSSVHFTWLYACFQKYSSEPIPASIYFFCTFNTMAGSFLPVWGS